MSPDQKSPADASILPPGRRLDGRGSTYQVAGPAWSGPRSRFLRGRKVLQNYRVPDRAIVAADEEEWLDVLIREPIQPGPGSDPDRLAFELHSVLALTDVPGLPEPLDVLDGGRLVLADPHADRLADRPAPDGPRLARELLALLDALHARGLTTGGLDPADLLVDPVGRWTFVGTDRVGPGDPAGDLAAWAELADGLIGDGPTTPEAAWVRERVKRVRTGRVGTVGELVAGPRWGGLRRVLGWGG